MLHLLALSGLIGVAASLVLSRPNDAASLPPQSNPNTATDYHEGHKRQPSDLVAAFDHPLDALSDAQCDFNAIVAASGDNLVNLVRGAPRRCVNGAFSVTGTRARDTCNEADMAKVAQGFFGTASSYNPANPGATPGILNFVQYLRGCLLQSYREKDVGTYSNNVVAQIKYGLDVFFNRPNLQAQNGDHYEIVEETLTLVSDAKEYLNYAGKLTLLSDWKFKSDLEKKILPFTKICPKTRTDTFIIRAQQISDAEANTVCQRLKVQEAYYHSLVKDNWNPVSPDVNDKIEVIIFNDVDEYKIWANLLFSISTDYAAYGVYMEGNPSQAGNIARLFCYELPKDGKFDVLNLEHEFTHYLDCRYDMKGGYFDIYFEERTVWWLEGFAEYSVNKNQYPSMVQDCKDKTWPLSTIFGNNFDSGQDRIYHYGYLAARFMFERHRSDVDTIVSNFRSGNYAAYETFMNGIVNRYDQEFSNWCTCIANGKPC